jgi:hypothetical protein
VRGLNDPWPLPVRWVPADASLADDWDALVTLAESGVGWPPNPGPWPAGPGVLAGKDNQLADKLRLVPTGRLVVLGPPGAGKTMLMIRLVLDLLQPGRRTSGGPVPVLVSAASWNPGEQRLRDWLATRLTIDYPNLAAAAGLPGWRAAGAWRLASSVPAHQQAQDTRSPAMTGFSAPTRQDAGGWRCPERPSPRSGITLSDEAGQG